MVMTKEKWHSLDCITRIDPDKVAVDTIVQADSLWFAGHFPGWPILTGIAMLSMVTEAVQYDERHQDNKVRITGIKRVRFRLPIRPDDPISISLSRVEGEKEDSYNFKIAIRQDIACTGIVTAERID
jgi:3-hydroxyacyl-[acyl-carrier-protein] dehydratase